MDVRHVRIRPKTLDDLECIIDYIAPEEPVAALRIVDAIETFCIITLRDNPHIGTVHNDVVEGIRIFPLVGYRICYFVRDNTDDPHIDVVRILHQARDVSKHLREFRS